jgi:hypothetical protein
MTALAAARSTVRWGGGGPERLYELQMAASTTIFQGSLVCLNASGLLVPGSTATTLRALGRAEETKVSGASGVTRCKVSTGVFKYANDGGDPVTAAARGAVCYITDDQTVSITSTGKSVAGVVVEVDSDGVWVNIGLEQK